MPVISSPRRYSSSTGSSTYLPPTLGGHTSSLLSKTGNLSISSTSGYRSGSLVPSSSTYLSSLRSSSVHRTPSIYGSSSSLSGSTPLSSSYRNYSSSSYLTGGNNDTTSVSRFGVSKTNNYNKYSRSSSETEPSGIKRSSSVIRSSSLSSSTGKYNNNNNYSTQNNNSNTNNSNSNNNFCNNNNITSSLSSSALRTTNTLLQNKPPISKSGTGHRFRKLSSSSSTTTNTTPSSSSLDQVTSKSDQNHNVYDNNNDSTITTSKAGLGLGSRARKSNSTSSIQHGIVKNSSKTNYNSNNINYSKSNSNQSNFTGLDKSSFSTSIVRDNHKQIGSNNIDNYKQRDTAKSLSLSQTPYSVLSGKSNNDTKLLSSSLAKATNNSTTKTNSLLQSSSSISSIPSSLAKQVATSGLDIYEKYSPANYKPKCELSRSRSLSEATSTTATTTASPSLSSTTTTVNTTPNSYKSNKLINDNNNYINNNNNNSDVNHLSNSNVDELLRNTHIKEKLDENNLLENQKDCKKTDNCLNTALPSAASTGLTSTSTGTTKENKVKKLFDAACSLSTPYALSKNNHSNNKSNNNSIINNNINLFLKKSQSTTTTATTTTTSIITTTTTTTSSINNINNHNSKNFVNNNHSHCNSCIKQINNKLTNNKKIDNKIPITTNSSKSLLKENKFSANLLNFKSSLLPKKKKLSLVKDSNSCNKKSTIVTTNKIRSITANFDSNSQLKTKSIKNNQQQEPKNLNIVDIVETTLPLENSCSCKKSQYCKHQNHNSNKKLNSNLNCNNNFVENCSCLNSIPTPSSHKLSQSLKENKSQQQYNKFFIPKSSQLKLSLSSPFKRQQQQKIIKKEIDEEEHKQLLETTKKLPQIIPSHSLSTNNQNIQIDENKNESKLNIIDENCIDEQQSTINNDEIASEILQETSHINVKKLRTTFEKPNTLKIEHKNENNLIAVKAIQTTKIKLDKTNSLDKDLIKFNEKIMSNYSQNLLLINNNNNSIIDKVITSQTVLPVTKIQTPTTGTVATVTSANVTITHHTASTPVVTLSPPTSSLSSSSSTTITTTLATSTATNHLYNHNHHNNHNIHNQNSTATTIDLSKNNISDYTYKNFQQQQYQQQLPRHSPTPTITLGLDNVDSAVVVESIKSLSSPINKTIIQTGVGVSEKINNNYNKTSNVNGTIKSTTNESSKYFYLKYKDKDFLRNEYELARSQVINNNDNNNNQQQQQINNTTIQIQQTDNNNDSPKTNDNVNRKISNKVFFSLSENTLSTINTVSTSFPALSSSSTTSPSLNGYQEKFTKSNKIFLNTFPITSTAVSVVDTNNSVTANPFIHKTQTTTTTTITTADSMNCLQNCSELLDDIKFIDSDDSERQQQQRYTTTTIAMTTATKLLQPSISSYSQTSVISQPTSIISTSRPCSSSSSSTPPSSSSSSPSSRFLQNNFINRDFNAKMIINTTSSSSSISSSASTSIKFNPSISHSAKVTTLPLTSKRRDLIVNNNYNSNISSNNATNKYNTLNDFKRIPIPGNMTGVNFNRYGCYPSTITSTNVPITKSSMTAAKIVMSSITDLPAKSSTSTTFITLNNTLSSTTVSNSSSRDSTPSNSPQLDSKRKSLLLNNYYNSTLMQQQQQKQQHHHQHQKLSDNCTASGSSSGSSSSSPSNTLLNDKKQNKSSETDESIRNVSTRSVLPPSPSRYLEREGRSSTLSSRKLVNDNDDSTTSTKSSYLNSSSSLDSYDRSSGKIEGLCGLRNIGNTCFMNSVIQCLSHTKELTKFLKTQATIRSTSKDQHILSEFAKLIREMWSPNVHSVTPLELKSAFSSKHRMYSGYNQQDAQEFLRFFLDSLHCALNTGTKGETLKMDDNLSDNEKANITWDWYTKVENSVIKDLFVGQLKSTLKCTTCGNTSVTFDPFWDLSLPLPSSSSLRCKLDTCLELFIKEEVLDGDEMPTCSKCKTRRKCTKSFTIQKFPKYLVIHLKRFSETRWSKLSNVVEFPVGERELNMAPYASNSSTNALYTLYAISNHMGSTAGGHYVALCRHPVTKKWHEFNDNVVSDALSESSLVSSSAYLLFYERA